MGNPPMLACPRPRPHPTLQSSGGTGGTRLWWCPRHQSWWESIDNVQAEQLRDVPAAVCLGKGSLGGGRRSVWQDPALVFTETWGLPDVGGWSVTGRCAGEVVRHLP